MCDRVIPFGYAPPFREQSSVGVLAGCLRVRAKLLLWFSCFGIRHEGVSPSKLRDVSKISNAKDQVCTIAYLR